MSETTLDGEDDHAFYTVLMKRDLRKTPSANKAMGKDGNPADMGKEDYEVMETDEDGNPTLLKDNKWKDTPGVSDKEFTWDEMIAKQGDWLGKKINYRHSDDKGAQFGEIVATWINKKDGTTHAKIRPGTSELGVQASRDIMDGKITSVSPGWIASCDARTQDCISKYPDHMALTNNPVYEGTVFYAYAASRDDVANNGDDNDSVCLMDVEGTDSVVRIDRFVPDDLTGDSLKTHMLSRIVGSVAEREGKFGSHQYNTKKTGDDMWVPNGWANLLRRAKALDETVDGPKHRLVNNGKKSQQGGEFKNLSKLSKMSSVEDKPEAQKKVAFEEGDSSAQKGANAEIIRSIFGEKSIRQSRAPNGQFARFSGEASEKGGIASDEKDGIASDDSRGTKRQREETAECPSSTGGLAPMSSVVEKNLPINDSTPVQMSASEYSKYVEMEANMKAMKEKLNEVASKAEALDGITRAMGTKNVDEVERFLAKAQETEGKKEAELVDLSVEKLDALASKVTDQTYKNGLERLSGMFKKLRSDPKNLLTTGYEADIKPIVTSMVAASMDTECSLVNLARAEEENKELKRVLEEERKARITAETRLGMKNRGHLSSAPSQWHIHASRDASTASSGGGPPPASGLGRLSSFSASSTSGYSASSVPMTGTSASSMNNMGGNPSYVPASSGSIFGTSASSINPSNASSGMSEKAMGKLPASSGSEAMNVEAHTIHRTKDHTLSDDGVIGLNDAGVVTFRSAADAMKGNTYDVAYKQFLQRKCNVSRFKAFETADERKVASMQQRELVAALKDAPTVPDDPRMWQSFYGLKENDYFVPVQHNGITFV